MISLATRAIGAASTTLLALVAGANLCLCGLAAPVAAGAPCGTWVYVNDTPNVTYVLFLPPGQTAVEDVSLIDADNPTTARWVCAYGVRLGGLGTAGQPETFAARIELWSDCPDEPGAAVLHSQVVANLPNFGLMLDVPVAIPAGAEVQVPDAFFVGVTIIDTVGGLAANEVFWIGANDTTDPGDQGATIDGWFEPDGDETCANDAVIFPPRDGLYGGFAIVIAAIEGDLEDGACCLTDCPRYCFAAGAAACDASGGVFTPGVACDAPEACGGAFDPADCCPGDVNTDGLVTGADIVLFVIGVVSGQPECVAGGPAESIFCGADLNRDGVRDAADIAPFVTALLAGVCP